MKFELFELKNAHHFNSQSTFLPHSHINTHKTSIASVAPTILNSQISFTLHQYLSVAPTILNSQISLTSHQYLSVAPILLNCHKLFTFTEILLLVAYILLATMS